MELDRHTDRDQNTLASIDESEVTHVSLPFLSFCSIPGKGVAVNMLKEGTRDLLAIGIHLEKANH